MRKSTNGTTVACAVLPDCDDVRNWTNTKASSSRVFGDLSVMGPLLNRDAQLELWRSADLSLPRQRTRSAPSREGARRERSAVVAPGTK